MTREDLVAALSGLAPGEYRSRDLLPQVNAWLEERGRDGVGAKEIGESIHRVLGLDSRRSSGNVRAFLVTPEAVAGRNWFKP